MKLKSKEIFPVEARDKLVANVGKIDNGVCDMRVALEWAEAKCFELNKELEKFRKGTIETTNTWDRNNRM